MGLCVPVQMPPQLGVQQQHEDADVPARVGKLARRGPKAPAGHGAHLLKQHDKNDYHGNEYRRPGRGERYNQDLFALLFYLV